MVDVVANLMVYLPEKDTKTLKASSYQLTRTVNAINRDNNFWKRRVERLLDIKFNKIGINWKIVHDYIYNTEEDKLNDLNKGLIQAAEDGNVDVVDILILAGINPSKDANTAIIYARSSC